MLARTDSSEVEGTSVCICCAQAGTAITVVVLHVAHRSPRTNRLPPYARRLFSRLLATPLLMRPPPSFEFDELAPRPPPRTARPHAPATARAYDPTPPSHRTTSSRPTTTRCSTRRNCLQVDRERDPLAATAQRQEQQPLPRQVGSVLRASLTCWPAAEERNQQPISLLTSSTAEPAAAALQQTQNACANNYSEFSGPELTHSELRSLVQLYSSLPRALESPRMAFLASRAQRVNVESADAFRSPLDLAQFDSKGGKHSRKHGARSSAKTADEPRRLTGTCAGDSSPLADDPVIRTRLGPSSLASLVQSQNNCLPSPGPGPGPVARGQQLIDEEGTYQSGDQLVGAGGFREQQQQQQELSASMRETLRSISYLADLRLERELDQMVCIEYA